MSNTTGVIARNGVFGSLVSVPVVLLNGLTVIWMIQLRQICNKQKVLFIGHLLADLFVGCFVLIEAQSSFYGRNSIELCLVNVYAGQIFGTITSLMAVLQTADKFLIMQFTYWYSAWVTWQRALIIVVFVYILSVAVVLGLFLDDFDISVICSAVTIGGKKAYLFITILYIFSIIAISVMWIFIGKTVRRHRRSINDTLLGNTVIVKEIKLALTIGIITCLYGLCYMPSVVYLIMILKHWATREQYVRDNPTTVHILFLLGNSLLNPVVYIWRMEFYRNSCVRKLQNMFSSGSSANNTQSSVQPVNAVPASEVAIPS